MSVCPIDTGRYGRPEMVSQFTDEKRLATWLYVESIIARLQGELGIIPKDAAEDIYNVITYGRKIKIERVNEIEKRTNHDIAAMVEAISEMCSKKGQQWVHFGLTSNDIKDTALGLQIKFAFDIIQHGVGILQKLMVAKMREYSDIIAAGRTHGQQATPTTYGIRFAVWNDDLWNHLLHVIEVERRIPGKVSGTTGSHSIIGVKGLELQHLVMEAMYLKICGANTQIVQREVYAEVIFTLANIAATLEKIATDIRNLQRTEINEVSEGFSKGQIGSSAMPHKRNPIKCENICGIARYIRSLVAPALEDVVSWEERDLTQSSVERFIIPQAFILTDYILSEMIDVIRNLVIKKENINLNMIASNGEILSEYLASLLIKNGVGRIDAMEAIKKCRSGDINNLLDAFIAAFPDVEVDLEGYYKSIIEVSRKITRKNEVR
jgi:adenylosuccinate lyase